MTKNELEILLVEDNPGDARLLEEMVAGHEPLTGHIDGAQAAETPVHDHTVAPLSTVSEVLLSVTHVTRLSAGLDRLDEPTDDGPAVVLLDLNLPDSEGLETLKTALEHADSVPIVVLTGLQDRHFGVQALQYGAHEYLVKDEINSDLLIRTLFHAIEREAYERQVATHRDRLETLNQLNTLVQDITQTLIQQSTREEIEQAVCEELTSARLYTSAWIGDIDSTNEHVILRANPGMEDASDGSSMLGGIETPGYELMSEVVRTKEVQVYRRRSGHDPTEYNLWPERADTDEYRAVAVIPIVYEQTPYGVLTIYSARPGAFESDERTVIGRLGEIIGHAINGVEATKRLHADSVVELEFESTDPDLFLIHASDHLDCAFTLDRTVPAADGELLFYITVDGASPEAVLDIASQTKAVEHARLITDGFGNESVIELIPAGSSAILTLTNQGAKVTNAIVEQGEAQFTAEVAPQSDVRAFVDELTAKHPDVDFVARRERDRPLETRQDSWETLEQSLTERQRACLEAAYFAGFFEWPRESTGEEVAESLSVSSPTFHQHLRHAEQKVISEMLDRE